MCVCGNTKTNQPDALCSVCLTFVALWLQLPHDWPGSQDDYEAAVGRGDVKDVTWVGRATKGTK
jgi:hypothetical protein